MSFADRHLGSGDSDVRFMLETVGFVSMEELIDATIPAAVRARSFGSSLPEPCGEERALQELRERAAQNRVCRSYIGMGYYGCHTPAVIQRNILENPGWYTQYTPYQAEISQGRLEALLNFQTMVADLTGLPLANASLLDEATAAAEALTMCRAVAGEGRHVALVADGCHPQTIAVVRTRLEALGAEVRVVANSELVGKAQEAFGVLLQYPTTDGLVEDYSELVRELHDAGALVAVATDLLALTCLRAPGEFGADVAVGSSQRFGVPMGYGGPHAAFFATRMDYRRHLPGRLIGISKDSLGNPAYRLSLQTREQHIRREKATSNICTAQVLLAIMAAFYAIHHGPKGLKAIAERVHKLTALCGQRLRQLGFKLAHESFFDTLRVELTRSQSSRVLARAELQGINFRAYSNGDIGLSFDETTTEADVHDVLRAIAGAEQGLSAEVLDANLVNCSADCVRTGAYLEHPVFNEYHSEHELLRYMVRLQSRDLSLTTSMIPLGSCTMKLNAAAEMIALSWPEFAALHPYAPAEQAVGYHRLFAELAHWLSELTGFPAVSLQPNSGAQGELAGLLAICNYHQHRGETRRDVCLIPTSAHGTNAASATLAGLKVVPVSCDSRGNVDIAALRECARGHQNDLAALMITYPSTHGVFESGIREICDVIHEAGGQVYLDGANMNAQVGLCRPAEYGADVCHLNLHKTFAIPHGGGGPGVGPVAAAKHLAAFLPGHPLHDDHAGAGPVAEAPWGSASILTIPWAYIRLMGLDGLRRASELAILNANYMAKRLSKVFEIVFVGDRGTVAHEFILDVRPFRKTAGIEPEDIAKRLMDYGFHAPTMSWPVAGTLMVEPTETESKAELDRFCEAMELIRREIGKIESGEWNRDNNPLKNAPHTAQDVVREPWHRPYTREEAAYPASWLRVHKYWPYVGRVDNAYGDRNLVCTC